MVAIETKWLGPTNTQPGRYKAFVPDDFHWKGTATRTATVSAEDTTLDAGHWAAAAKLITALGWTPANGYGDWVGGQTAHGMVFVCITKDGHAKVRL